jgi:hypothetical protein
MKTATLGAPTAPLPDRARNSSKILLALFGVCWIVLLPFTVSRTLGAPEGIAALLVWACIVIAIVATRRIEALYDARRVLSAHRTPATQWQAWTRETLLAITGYWALICTSLAVQMALPGSAFYWLAGPAVLSLALCATVQRVRSRIGLAGQAWKWAINIACAALVFCAISGPRFTGLGDWISALPTAALLACFLSWPAMAYMLLRQWRTTSVDDRSIAAKPVAAKTGMIVSFFKRYSMLRWDDSIADENQHARQTLATRVLNTFSGEIFFYIILLQTLPVHWGDSASPLRLVGLYVVCLVTASRLMVRNLHWRSLLLPGGMRRKRLGTHIFAATLGLQLLALPFVALIYFAASVTLGTPPQEALLRIASAAILPFELALTTALAVALRASGKRRLIVIAGIGPFVIGIAYQLLAPRLAGSPFLLMSPQWTIGPVYVLVLATCTVILLWLANRMWTVEKLFRQLRRN